MLEMRFPDTEEGWEQWRNLVRIVSRFDTGYTAAVEEIEPGRLKAILRLK